MSLFPRRPLSALLCCLFAGAQPLWAAELGGFLSSTVPIELAALDSPPIHLRVERKFFVLKKRKPVADPAWSAALAKPPLAAEDSYPLFLTADEIRGQTDDLTEAVGHVELRKHDLLLLANQLSYSLIEDQVDAKGDVHLIQEGTEIDTPHLQMRLAEQIGFAEAADFRIAKAVASKLYRPEQSVVSTAVSSTVSGAPMMLNVPNSYGLPTSQPTDRITEAHGHAEKIQFEGENQLRLLTSTFTTCKPGDSDWYLKGEEIHLDYDQNVAQVNEASLWFKEVPFLYVPTASFALNHRRKSGLLHPSFSTSSKNGLDLNVPFYWNIAPDYDMTLHTRLIGRRGMQLGSETRYLDHHYTGNLRVEYMPEDQQTGKERYGYSLQHQHNLGQGVSAVINWQGVSDDLYQQDMSSRLLQTSQVQLPRQVTLGYAPSSWLQTSLSVLRYQTLQPDPANPVTRPYFVEPQINLIGYRPDFMAGDLTVFGQFSRFTNPLKVEGDRMVLYPQLALPIVHPAFQITPKVGVHLTQYNLSNQGAAMAQSLQRTVPTFSLDATVNFERPLELLAHDYIQTLEPRLFYVNIPHRDQSAFPLFDSGLSDFNFAQIFAENRYTGQDRINDANQLTAAVTTRLLDAETGVERFRAMVGQRYYFKPQSTTLVGEAVRNENFSNLIAGITGLVAPKTYADSAWEFDYHNQRSQRLSAGMRYQPDYGKVLSASYRYTRDALTNTGLVDQIDLAGQWPISPRWYAVGRYNYSLRDQRPLETIAGFEYNAGCWSARLVTQRLEAIVGAPNTTLFFQLELNDFGSIGSNPLQLLRRTVPGYGKTNELPTQGSLLTTE